MRCPCITTEKHKFIKSLFLKLSKLDKDREDAGKIKTIVNDIFEYLKNKSNFVTNQEALGFHNVFRGIVVKNWIDNELDYKYNKIIIYEAVHFYYKCWLQRCEVVHEEQHQKRRLIAWYHNLVQRMKLGDKYHLKRYIENRKLNTDDANNETIRHWIRGALQMEKTTSEYRHQDIRNWFKSNISERKKKRPHKKRQPYVKRKLAR